MSDAIDNEIAKLEGRLERMRKLLTLRIQTRNAAMMLKVGDNHLADLDAIHETVCKHFKVRLEDIYSNSRQSDFALARHVIFYFAKRLLNETYTCIGKRYHRDHAAVMHGVRRIEEKLRIEPRFLSQVLEMEKQCHRKLENLPKE